MFIVLWSINLTPQSQNNNALIDPVLRYSITGKMKDQIAKSIVTSQDGPHRYPVVVHGSHEAIDGIQYLLIRKYDTFGTATLTAKEIYQISDYPGIRYIEYSPLHELQLDISRADIKADSVHAGIINNTSYTGRGVIIGLIDTGLDFFHDDFRHPDDPDQTRVLRIWDLSLTPIEGESHPEGFEVGVEYTRDDIERDLRQETNEFVRTRDSHGHGTHVAGIAGGGGVKHNGKYTGIAPNVEFVLVKFPGTSISTQEIIHGIEYIFSAADKLDRPAVINISLGGHMGSHDGTAGHEKLINQYAQYPGRITVVAAGNSGASENHTGEVVPGGESSIYSLTVQRDGRGEDYIMMFMWYEGTESLQLIVETPSGIRDTVTTNYDTYIIETEDGGIDIATHPDSINEKGARLFSIYLADIEQDKLLKEGDWKFTVSAMDENTEFRYNTWIVSQSMTLNRATLSPSTGRRNTVTMPGTAEKAITVGAYHSKLNWVNVNNNNIDRWGEGSLQDIIPFSGGGPTRDLRMKPDITAPGKYVASALSADATYPPLFRLRDQGYVVLSGTSMSTAHVTGLVALMLEGNPLLKSSDILEILRETSRSDEYATNLPNFDWGWGKPNALAAVQEASVFVTERSIAPGIPATVTLRQNYPNPFNPSTTISFSVPERQHITLAVYDVLGREVAVLIDKELQSSYHQVVFKANNLPSGIYFYRLKAGSTVKTKRMSFIK